MERSGECIVTGVAGFVGSHLAERLLSMGCRVVGVDNFYSGYRENMASFADHPEFTFYEASVCEKELVKRLKRVHPDLAHCFHLAAIVSVPYSVAHSEETMEVNLNATVAMLRDAEELGFQSFAFAGSAAEYGDEQRQPILESSATEETVHLSPYGESKFLASRQVAASSIGVALRCFNIYGPRQDPGSPYSGVISRFMDRALTGKPLTIFGDGLQTRDFVYVSDVVEAYVRAAGLAGLRQKLPGGFYNVGTGTGISVLELAEAVRELTGNREPIGFQPERPGDIRHSVASIDALRNASGWVPAVPLKEGLKRLKMAGI